MLEYSIGQGYSALDAQAWRDKLDGYAVASGLGVSVDSGLDLTVAAGTATVGETNGSVDTVTLGSSTTVNVGPADSTDPRKDTIYIDTSGTVQVESGTPEPADPSGNTRFQTYQPEPPSPSTDGAILAEVWVAAGETTLQSADVRDRRAPADVVADRAVVESIPGVYDGTNVVADVDNDSVSTGILEIDGGDAVSDFEFGTATLTGTGPASDGTVDSDESQTATVSFDSSFATTPKVILGGWSPVHPGVVISRDDITTSDFRLVYRNYSTTDRSSDQYTIDWLAVI